MNFNSAAGDASRQKSYWRYYSDLLATLKDATARSGTVRHADGKGDVCAIGDQTGKGVCDIPDSDMPNPKKPTLPKL
jgi:hypothetical protein